MSAASIPVPPSIQAFSAWIATQQHIATDRMCAACSSPELAKHIAASNELQSARSMLSKFELEFYSTRGATA